MVVGRLLADALAQHVLESDRPSMLLEQIPERLIRKS
jgi:hypothetical protein